MNNIVNNRWAFDTLNYDRYRPSIPKNIVQRLVTLYGESVGVVLDLGCGTGLSTKPWADFAEQVIGVDPSEEMLAIATNRLQENVSYFKGSGHAIPLENESVNIVVCHASIHWMDPEPTMKEIKRVLKPQGMFVILNHNWPPVSNDLTLDAAYFTFKSKVGAMVAEKDLYQHYYYRIDRFSKWLYETKQFELFREFYMHQEVMWTLEQFVGFTYTYGDLALLLQQGVSKSELYLDILEEKMTVYFQEQERQLLFSWRVDVFKGLL